MLINERMKEKILEIAQLHCISIVSFLIYVFAKLFFVVRATGFAQKLILTSIRYYPSVKSISYLSTKYRQGFLNFEKQLSFPAEKKDAEGRAIILSSPYVHEGNLIKGVALLSFSHTFSFFLSSHYWEILNKNFAFILEPSWAGYADPDILHFAEKADHCIIQASEISDRFLINSLFPHVPCLDTGASNWVDHRKFENSPGAVDKEYDAIYVANLNPIKRVYRSVDYFCEAISKNSAFKAVIVCASWGTGSIGGISEYIREKGVQGNIKVLEGMSQEKLIDLERKCKFSILLSLKEGSNRVLFESMFVGIPVICLSENIGVNKTYVNEQTGILANDKNLSQALLFMAENYKKFTPRDWALNNITPEITTDRLKKAIDNWFSGSVNGNLKVKVNSPEVTYLDEKLDKKYINDLTFSRINEMESLEFVSELNIQLNG